MRISDWSSDVCSSDLIVAMADQHLVHVFYDIYRNHPFAPHVQAVAFPEKFQLPLFPVTFPGLSMNRTTPAVQSGAVTYHMTRIKSLLYVIYFAAGLHNIKNNFSVSALHPVIRVVTILT